MTLGTRIVNELHSRRLAGYFSYEQYKELKDIDTPGDLETFVEKHGLPARSHFDDPPAFVDSLQENDMRNARKGAVLAICDVLFLGIPSAVILFGNSLSSLIKHLRRGL